MKLECDPEVAALLGSSRMARFEKLAAKAWANGYECAILGYDFNRYFWRNITPYWDEARFDRNSRLTKYLPYYTFSDHTITDCIKAGKACFVFLEDARKKVSRIKLDPNIPYLCPVVPGPPTPMLSTHLAPVDQSMILPGTVRIIDLGGWKGQFTQYFIRAFPGSMIDYTIYEPAYKFNPFMIRRKLDPFRIVNKLVAGTDQEGQCLDFAVDADMDGIGSSLYATPQSPAEVLTAVPVISLETILSVEDQVDYLKINIEGSEVPALNTCSDENLKKCRQLSIEFHTFMFPDVCSAATVDSIVKRLESLGFHSQLIYSHYPQYYFTQGEPRKFRDRVYKHCKW